jgi:hypothetical protein
MKQFEASPCLAAMDVGEIAMALLFCYLLEVKVRVFFQSSVEEKQTSVE